MRKKTILILITLSILIGAWQTGKLMAASTAGGNIWDSFIDTSSFSGTKITGTLSIGYLTYPQNNPYPGVCGSLPQATMFYTARLNYNKKLYTYTGATNVCKGDVGMPGSGGQGDVIMAFLESCVLQMIPTGVTEMRLKSVTNAGYDADNLSFVSDIMVMVR
jgi:hypothetical protein